jgi:hypothetical protein
MAKALLTIKTSPEVLRMLRLVAAATGEYQYEVLVRLLQKDILRLKKQGKI